MATAVAVPASEPEFLDDGMATVFVVGIVVVLEEVGRAAVDTHPISLSHNPALTSRRMPVPAGCVDRPSLRVVDQHP
jgi:hypothetical protein